MAAITRTAAQKAILRDAILERIPWPTPLDEIHGVFAAQAAAAPGDLARQVACWLNIDWLLEGYERQPAKFSGEELAAIGAARSALRRVQVPAAGALLVAAAWLMAVT